MANNQVNYFRDFFWNFPLDWNEFLLILRSIHQEQAGNVQSSPEYCQREKLIHLKYSRVYEKLSLTGKLSELMLLDRTINLQNIQIVFGSQSSLYAFAFIYHLLKNMMPGIFVIEYLMVISGEKCLSNHNHDEIICLQVIHISNTLKPTITNEIRNFDHLSSAPVLFISTFLDCAETMSQNQFHTKDGDESPFSVQWTEKSDQCFLVLKELIQPTVTVWINGEPNLLPNIFRNSIERVDERNLVDLIFLCHSHDNLTFTMDKYDSHHSLDTKEVFIGYLPTFATTFYELNEMDYIPLRGFHMNENFWKFHPISLFIDNPINKYFVKDPKDSLLSAALIEDSSSIIHQKDSITKQEIQIGYLYHNCDRMDREYFFSFLQTSSV